MNITDTKNAPAAIGPYSQAISVGNLLFTSGQIPLDPATGAVVGETVEQQAEQAVKYHLVAVAPIGGQTVQNGFIRIEDFKVSLTEGYIALSHAVIPAHI